MPQYPVVGDGKAPAVEIAAGSVAAPLGDATPP
jgi:hypothetical protein